MNKTLIKWPGGKSSEIRQFVTMIPDYDRYVEPFAGGAALYFYLRPMRAVLNDNSRNLMDFYELVKEQDPEFHKILDAYNRSFSALKAACDEEYQQILALYKLYAYAEKEGIPISQLKIHLYVVQQVLSQEDDLCSQVLLHHRNTPGENQDPAGWKDSIILDRTEFEASIEKAVHDKFIRTAQNERKKPFTPRDLKANLITGFMEGYYLYFRKVFNGIASGRIVASRAYAAANFYFIREYCYGSMFRYNKEGEFNIPYGGISYNKKDLTSKISHIFSDSTARLFARTKLYCEDFETLIDKLKLTEHDFMFLDPPYDTEFSDYEGNQFRREDQVRLARCLARTKAQFLLVIKNTDFIYELYEPLKFRMLSFENRYIYNVRSRNERMVQHLIITNIPEGQVPWIRENM